MKRACLFPLIGLLVLASSSIKLPASATLSERHAVSPQASLFTCGGEFPVIADASITNTAPDQPYGDGFGVALYSNDAEDEGRALMAVYLGGDILADAAILNAELVMAIYESGPPYPYSFDIYSLEGDFEETTVTWNNQPPLGTRFQTYNAYQNDGELRIDITALVAGWVQGAVSETLALVPNSPIDLSFRSRESGSGARVEISCALPTEAVPQDMAEYDDAQMLDIVRLGANSEVPLVLELGTGGSVRFAGFVLPVPSYFSPGSTESALWFFEDYKALLRLDNPSSELQLFRRSPDGQQLFFRQRVQGIPVYPSELVVRVEDGSYTSLHAGYVPHLLPSAPAAISATAAERLALDYAQGTAVSGETQLVYLNGELLGLDDTGTYLSWRVNVAAFTRTQTVYVNAHTGKVLFVEPHADAVFDLALYTGNQDGPFYSAPCWDLTQVTTEHQWFDENGPYAKAPDPVPPNPDAEGALAFNDIQAIYQYFKTTFGRDSFDGQGGLIRLYLDVGFNWDNASYSWGCDIFQFAEGYATNDIIAHEFTHGVTRKTSNLVYANQSGALNESFSDIFAYYIDSGDWLMGEDTPDGASRSMQNPPAYGDPDRMSLFEKKTSDYGGVHTNNAIHNKAAYLAIQGDNFNGWIVNGIGNQKSQRLFYNMLTGILTLNADFLSARNAAVWQSYIYALREQHGFTMTDVCQVRNAYAAVEIGTGDPACQGITANLPPDGDSDGVPDAKDNCPFVANPSQRDLDRDNTGDECDNDLDGDGLGNSSDNCPSVPNPGQEDHDTDNIGDVCEDTDGDGVYDIRDNCPIIPNSDQTDRDKDGIGNICDSDLDGDGYDNTVDNCPETYNPSQGNEDGDKHGNACDLCYYIKSDDNSDIDRDWQAAPCDDDDDGDGVKDVDDNCPDVPNPNQYDGDGNNIGYACDSNERAALVDGTGSSGMLVFPSFSPWTLPLPACDNCTAPYLPHQFQQTININLETGFIARVVDSTGMQVATTDRSEGAESLTYFPAPYALPSGGINVQGVAAGSSDLAPDQIAYTLEIYPLSQLEPGQTFPLEMHLTSSLTRVFLPVVIR